MGILTSLSLEEVRARGSIKDADVLRLRRAFNDDHTICADEAEALMALNEACPIKEPSWGAPSCGALLRGALGSGGWGGTRAVCHQAGEPP